MGISLTIFTRIGEAIMQSLKSTTGILLHLVLLLGLVVLLLLCDLLFSQVRYIQWLFPIREHGMNDESQPLQLHEIEKMKVRADRKWL
jgi:hypothetical protein